MGLVCLGYDPGGGGAHGVAALHDGQAESDTLRTGREATERLLARCRPREDVVLGVDTLTLWSSGPSGWRPADRELRAKFPLVNKSIIAPNSIFGSMPLNGAVVMRRLSEAMPGIRITETHPKVLWFALAGTPYDYADQSAQMRQRLDEWIGLGPLQCHSEHAWDALVSAYAAREWGTGTWVTDLHALPCSPEEDLVPVCPGSAHYAWPEPTPRAAGETGARIPASPPHGKPGRPSSGELWRSAAELLREAGHDDVACLIEEYRNIRGEKSGWDAWLKSNHPALWGYYEAARE